ncbi:hypothetical protein C8R48DRAFT_732919 [Suillus tomentosus]|nr:hypothetical protein C8R48DRAFT_732919 [Suillus tomentosus]
MACGLVISQYMALFAGGQADGLSWWKLFHLIHPLKVCAVTVLSIIGHVGRTFSDLGITQSA